MLHEFTGYYYNYGDIAGGGLYVLENPGRSLRLRDLGRRAVGRGTCTTPALSYDGQTIYSAFVPVREGERPVFPPLRRGEWMLRGRPRARAVQLLFAASVLASTCYAMAPTAGGCGSSTDGGDDDTDPCPLPDGGVAFLSARRGGFCRCNNDLEPMPTYTLHLMRHDGSGLRPSPSTRRTSGTPRCWPTAASPIRRWGLRRPLGGQLPRPLGEPIPTAPIPSSSSATTLSGSALFPALRHPRVAADPVCGRGAPCR